MQNLWLVMLGGGLGSACRFYLSEWLTFRVVERLGIVFPYGTMAVNLLGCLLIGVVAGLATESNLIPPAWRVLLLGGFLGGFTTFSTFAWESWSLGADGDLIRMGVNIIASVMGGVLAVLLGLLLARALIQKLIA